MTNHIETLHLDTVIAKHTRDMTDRVTAVTGTTSGTGYVCARARPEPFVTQLDYSGNRPADLHSAVTKTKSSLHCVPLLAVRTRT